MGLEPFNRYQDMENIKVGDKFTKRDVFGKYLGTPVVTKVTDNIIKLTDGNSLSRKTLKVRVKPGQGTTGNYYTFIG